MRKHSPMSMFFKSVSEVVDQEQLVHNDTGYIGNAAGVTVFGAQSFQLSGNKIVNALECNIEGIYGTFSGNITCTIETDDSDKPSGILADVNATKIMVPAVGISRVQFAIPFELSGGTTYWIVNRCNVQTIGNYFANRADTTEPYANGHISAYYMGSWHSVASDSYFKIFVRA